MPKIYALLVGINAYPSPISTLGGCLKDIDQIEAYLKSTVDTMISTSIQKEALSIQQYGNLQICRLQDEQATHTNITKGFDNFLQQATASDIVWFHFSGHGAEQKTATEFLPLEPNGKDQTLVCYQTPESTDHLHLADKELAVFLHKVAAFDMEGHTKESPHIVVSLDCCHSGSGTRDFEENPHLKSRDMFSSLRSGAEMQQEAIRPLASYANGFYKEQLAEKGSLEVPLSKHLLISACESVQLAGDLPSGGIFTSGLITALKSAKGQLNYADLFVKTRASVQQLRENQTPQFEPIGNFDPYTRFLDGTALGTPNSFEIMQEGEKWFVKCGTIHGLSLNAKSISIQTRTATPKSIGTGALVAVGAQKSEFTWTKGKATSTATDYQAVLPSLMEQPVLVGLTGDKKGIDKLKAIWTNTQTIQSTQETAAKVDWGMEVMVENDAYKIRDCQQNRIVLSWEKSKESAEHFILDSLEKMVNWHRTLALNNKQSKIANWVDFEIDLLTKQGASAITKTGHTIKASTENCFPANGGLGLGFQPKVHIKNTTQDFYCYLLHFRRNYSITSEEGEVVYRVEEHNGQTTLPLLKAPMGWGLAAEDTDAEIWFKLIVTTEPLDHHQLLQSGLMGDRDVVFRFNPVRVSEEWFSRVIKVKMVRA